MVSLPGTLRCGFLFAVTFGLAAPALAQTAVVAAKTDAAVATAPTPPKILDEAALATTRGGQVVVIGNQSLTSTISGSTINGNYAAGAINFSDNALSNFNGLGNVVVNTGAQANLQSAMNLTINLGK